MTEHIERARTLNRQAYDDIDHGRLDAAKVALNEAIRLAPDLAAPTQIWVPCTVGKVR